MAYWLMKTEPETFSWADLKAKGAKGEPWDGVRNFQARNNMQKMAVGERGFFYHSGEAREVVGILEVIALAHPDPKDSSGVWKCVDVKALEAMPTPVTLEAIKANAKLKDMVLVKNSRLSVQPVSDAEWAEVCRMGALKFQKAAPSAKKK